MLAIALVLFERRRREPADYECAAGGFHYPRVAVVERRVANDLGVAPGLTVVVAACEVGLAPGTDVLVAVTGEYDRQLTAAAADDGGPADVAAGLLADDAGPEDVCGYGHRCSPCGIWRARPLS